jgi:mono/diheme cytochrome c family protein
LKGSELQVGKQILEGRANMNGKLAIATAIGAALLLSVPAAIQGADDGPALYKSKCSSCHGTKGEGKPAMKAPALKGSSLDASQIAERITKGKPDSKAPHKKAIAGLSEEQAKAIGDFVKTLK